jgi:hypothetical protein
MKQERLRGARQGSQLLAGVASEEQVVAFAEWPRHATAKYLGTEKSSPWNEAWEEAAGETVPKGLRYTRSRGRGT